MRRTASRSWRPVSRPVPASGPRGHPRSTTSTSTDRNRVALVGGDRERPRSGTRPGAGHDLGHLVAAHVLLGHPTPAWAARASSRAGRSAEPVTADRAGLDQPPHRGAVPVQLAPWSSPVSACASKWIIDTRPQPTCRAHAGRVRERDRVVAAQDGPGSRRPRPRVHRLLQALQADLGVAGRHQHVAASATSGPSAGRRPAPGWAGTRHAAGSR